MKLKIKNILPKLLLQLVLVLTFAFTLTGCFGSGKAEKKISIVYHLNGGDSPWLPMPDVNGNYYFEREGSSVKNGVFLMEPTKESWLFDGWYLEESLQTKYEPPMNKIPESDCNGKKMHLYAKWVDSVVIDSNNFNKFFEFSKNWNGGLDVLTAAVKWSFKTRTTIGYSHDKQYVFDPEKSESIELTMKLNSAVKNIQLNAVDYYEENGSVSGFRAGQTVASALNSVDYIFPEQSYTLYLLHKDPFKVTLDLNGGLLDGAVELDYLGGEILDYEDLPIPVKPGYKFIKWNGIGHKSGKPIIQNSIIKAEFIKEYVLSYKFENEDIAPAITLLEGDNIILPILTKEGFEFIGWYYDAALTQKVEYDGFIKDDSYIYPQIKIKDDTILYAKFEPILKISFDTNGGSAKEAIEIARTKTPDLGAIPTKTDLYFGGWYLDELFQTEYKNQPLLDNITLYAKWLKAININNQNFEDYFDVTTNFEKTSYVTPSGLIYEKAIKITLNISIKQKYINNKFNVYSGAGVNIILHKQHEDVCSNINFSSLVNLGNNYSGKISLSNCTINYSNNGYQVINKDSGITEFKFEYYVYNAQNVYDNIDHIYLDNFPEGDIFFLENE